MSGGHFDYGQYRFREVADELREDIAIESKPKKSEYDDTVYPPLPKDIIATFQETYDILLIAEQLVQRIDWLLSADDGEDSFRERLVEELNDLKEDQVKTTLGKNLIKKLLYKYKEAS